MWPAGRHGEGGGDRLGLAVSGGPDSLALLLLARAALGTTRIEAATVDHRLRAASTDEARFVADLCAKLGVPHRILPVTVPPGNLQAGARKARYAALAGWLRARGLAALATAHHADDQAETLLLRLNRGSGLAGLAGARAHGPVPGGEGLLVRPLLGWRRAELAAVVAVAGIEPVRDPANTDTRFARTRARAALANLGEGVDASGWAFSARHLAEAEQAIAMLAADVLATRVERVRGTASYTPAPGGAAATRIVEWHVLSALVEEIGGAAPRGGAVARALDRLVAGRPATLAGAQVVPIAGGGWRIVPETPRRG